MANLRFNSVDDTKLLDVTSGLGALNAMGCEAARDLGQIAASPLIPYKTVKHNIKTSATQAT